MNRANVVSGAIVVAFGAFVYWLSADVPDFTATDNLGGRFLPRLLAVGMMAAGAVLAVTGWFGVEIQGGHIGGRAGTGGLAADGERRRETPAVAPRERSVFAGLSAGKLRLLAFIAILAIYVALLQLVGYLAASILCFAALIAVAGERRPLHVAVGAVGIAVVLYLLFGHVFNIVLPTAALFAS